LEICTRLKFTRPGTAEYWASARDLREKSLVLLTRGIFLTFFLVSTLEVVTIDEQTDPPPGIVQVHKDGRLHALPPQRAPEALDLPQRLRTPRRRYDLADAALFQFA
jgi:hypothetical protein